MEDGRTDVRLEGRGEKVKGRYKTQGRETKVFKGNKNVGCRNKVAGKSEIWWSSR